MQAGRQKMANLVRGDRLPDAINEQAGTRVEYLKRREPKDGLIGSSEFEQDWREGQAWSCIVSAAGRSRLCGDTATYVVSES